MQNRTNEPCTHVYTVEFNWDTAEVLNDAIGGYSCRFPVVSETDVLARYVFVKRTFDGKAFLEFLNSDHDVLSFRVNDTVARAFMHNVEDSFLAPGLDPGDMDRYEGFRNR